MSTLKKMAAKSRVTLAWLAAITCLCLALYGGYRTLTYSLPLRSSNPYEASQMAADASEKAYALYNTGLNAYSGEDYTLAAQVLTKAYSALTQDGEAMAKNTALAAQIQFLIGLTNEKLKQNFEAIEAYKQCLRHNPDHMEAKYNLERLLSDRDSGGGEGGNKPGQKPGSGSGKQVKKGI